MLKHTSRVRAVSLAAIASIAALAGVPQAGTGPATTAAVTEAPAAKQAPPTAPAPSASALASVIGRFVPNVDMRQYNRRTEPVWIGYPRAGRAYAGYAFRNRLRRS